MYEGTRAFPREELYGLTSQLRRAAYSVPANIAEGSSRESKRDYLHLHLNPAESQRLAGNTKTTFACLHGLIKAVERESGKPTRVMALLTSAVVLGLSRIVSGQ